jgi:alpha-L-rhamnosidase
MNKLCSRLAIVVLLALAACRPSFEVYDLRCEGLVEPLGIDSAQPHFSWKIASDQPMQQAAYEIEVGPELWKSGKVDSDRQVMVPYAGQPLMSRQQTRWRVRVWNGDGKASAWSPWQRLGVGIIGDDRLKGEYIGAVPGEGRASLLRKDFEVKKTGTALLYVNSLGYHEAYLNGEKVSDAVLQPAVSQLDKRSLIVVYDVSHLIRKGFNELCLAIGSGWYKKATFDAVYDGALVKAELDVDGEPLVWTDASWEGGWNGYSDLGDWRPHGFGGELLDNRADPDWAPVDVVKIENITASMQMCEPCRIQEIVTPVFMERVGEDQWLVDFGKVVNALLDVEMPGLQAGDQVKIFYSDASADSFDPSICGYDEFVAAGEGDHFQNCFNHHIFRYVLFEGLKQAPEEVQAYRMRTDFETGASFTSSDRELNAIHDLVFRTMENLAFDGYMVDCASIERLGYGGDGNASAQSLQTVAGVSPLFLNWLQAWADSQKEDGGLPHTAPNPYKAGGGPYWCSFIVQAPWRVYMNYADTRPMDRFYPNMKHWLDYVDAYTVDGLLKQWPTPPTPPYRWWYLGDWAAPEGVNVQDPESIDLVNNCALAQSYEELVRMAQAMNLEADEADYRQRLEALRKRIHETFYHDGLYASGSQVDMIYPLLVGVVPDGLKEQVVAKLKERTETLYNGHLATGLVGIPVLTEWVTRAGECDWMYGMLKQHGYPGYLHMIDNGATGVWEHWDGRRSRLHNCFNGIGSWFYQALGGIVALEPGYRKVKIAPQIPAGLEWVEVTQPTPYGPITVKRKGQEVSYTVPVGITVEEND